MHTYDPSLPDQYWGNLLARLKQRISSAAGAFGSEGTEAHIEQTWWYRFEPFNEGDGLTARLALGGLKPPSPVFIIRFSDAAEPLIETDNLRWAESLEEAVAYVLERCRKGMTLPDAVQFDAQNGAVTATLAGQPFFDIFRMPSASTPSSALLKRAHSTLVGFRKAEHPEAELCSRIASWPGASRITWPGGGVRPVDPSQSVRLPHLPVPAEWLHTARTILEQSTLPSDTDSAQRLVAATFGAKDFNTLVHSSSEVAAGLAGPWVSSLWVGGSVEHVFSADPYTAFCDLIQLFRSRCTTWPQAVLRLTDSTHLHSLSLVIENGEHTLASAPDSYLIMSQLLCGWPEEHGNVEAARIALHDVSGGLLSGLFLAGEATTDRLVDHLVRHQLQVVATSEPWAFALKQNGPAGFFDKQLYVLRISSLGNVAKFDRVPCYKGSLVFDAGNQCWILFRDNGHTRPTAVMRTLLPEAIKVVHLHLPDSQKPYFGVDDEGKRGVTRLLSEQ